MDSPLRLLTSAVGIIAAGLLIVGCTGTPGSGAPTSSPAPSAGSDAATDDDADDIEGALLDDGLLFAVITTGSSTCVPRVDQVAAEGQTVTVTLVDAQDDDGAATACTSDLVPRASVGELPAGVDPTADITLQVTYGDIRDDVDLDGDPEATGTSGVDTGTPSAAWFDDGGLVLLTWGSSGCVPVVESLEASATAGSVTFVTDDEQICTMDMVPRATILDFGDDVVDDDVPFTLTLVGGGLDGTLQVG